MKKILFFLFIAAATFFLIRRCGKGDEGNSGQALPQVMIIPSDQSLQSGGALRKVADGNQSFIIRDYAGFLISNGEFKNISAFIQETFAKKGYPLTDFEQCLKQLETQAATNIADGIGMDAKTQLIQTARPDIIIEVGYYDENLGKNAALLSHRGARSKELLLSYSISAIDAYTNKVVANISATGIKTSAVAESIRKDMSKDKKIAGFIADIEAYFADVLNNGREITVKINVAEDSNCNLADINIEGDTFSDWIIDYMKLNTIESAYKMISNTDYEITFTNVRIPLGNEDGTQYGVYDWARDFQKTIRKNLGLEVKNQSQGLGEVVLTVKGI